MADDSDLSVRFGADTAPLEAGATEAAAQVADFGAQVAAISESIQAQTAAMQEGFAMMAEQMRESMKEVEAAEEEAEAGMAGLVASVREGASQISEFREGVLGFGEAVMAFFAVEGLTEWSKKMGEAGEQTEHMAQTLGTSIGNVQELNAAFAMMGVSQEKGSMAIEHLDRSFAMAKQGSKEQVDAFAELGVSTTQNYTQMELLGAVMDGFKEKADGPAKGALAMELFGRAGAALIPFLDLGKSGLEELNRVTSEYGVRNEEAVEKAAQLGSAWNENKVAMDGLNNIMAEAFAPTMTEVVQGMNGLIASYIASYKAGGDAKVATDLLVDGFKVLVSMAVALGEGVIAAFHFVKAAVEDGGVAFDTIKGTITSDLGAVETELRTFGQVAEDAFTLNWGKITGDWQAGMSQAAKIVADGQAKIKALHDQHAASVNSELGAAGKALTDNTWLKNLWDGKPHEQMKTSGEGEGDTSDLQNGNGGKQKDDLIQQLQQQLNEKEQADAQKSGEWLKDRTADELAFWTQSLGRAKAGSKDWLEIRQKMFDLDKQLNQQNLQNTTSKLDAEIQAATGNASRQEALQRDKIAATAAEYGQQSSQVQDAQRELDRMVEEHARQRGQIEIRAIQAQTKAAEDGIKAESEITKAGFEAQESALREGVADGTITKTQAAAAEVEITRRQVQQELAELQQLKDAQTTGAGDKFSAALTSGDVAAQQEAMTELLTINSNFQNQRAVIAAAGANKVKASEDNLTDTVRDHFQSIINPISQQFASMATGLIEHTTTFSQAWDRLLDDMLGKFIQWAVETEAKHIASEAAKTAATAAGVAARTTTEAAGHATGLLMTMEANEKQILSDAAAAAAGAYKALAGIPIVGPGLGAGAAAATFVAVEAFGNLASAEGGQWEVPGAEQLTMLHRNEMVLPASHAGPLRDAIRGIGSGGGGAAAPARGGDTHNWNVSSLDARGVKGFLRSNAGRSAVSGFTGGRR